MFTKYAIDYFDPIYHQAILNKTDRGLFFAPEAVKRINKTLSILLDSAEIHSLNFINEDPFCTLAYPSANFSQFNQLSGTLYLSDLCRSKVTVDGIMFFQWLLNKNLLEEYIISLLLNRLIQWPLDETLNVSEPVSNVDKNQILTGLLNMEGPFYEAWKRKFCSDSRRDIYHIINTELDGAFDRAVVIKILDNSDNEITYEQKVIRAFVAGQLNLSRTDKVYRLAFLTGKNTEILDINTLFQNLEINEDKSGRLVFNTDGGSKQLFRFYSTYYEVLLDEIIRNEKACYYRRIFLNALQEYVSKPLNEEQILDLLFLHDFEFWHKLNFSTKLLCRREYEYKSFFQIKSSKKISLGELREALGEVDCLIDISAPREGIDGVWFAPDYFNYEKVGTDRRINNLEKLQNEFCFSFFSQGDKHQLESLVKNIFESKQWA